MLQAKINKTKKIILAFIFLSLPLGYFARVSLGEVFIGLYYWDILISIFLSLSVLLYFLDKAESKINLPFFYKAIIVFLIYAVLVTLNSYRYLDSIPNFVISAMYLVRWAIYVLFGIALFVDIKLERINWTFVKNLLILEGILIAIAGFLQLIFIPDFTILDKDLLWDPHQNRLSGFYFDPNFAGIILVLTLSVLVSDILNLIESKTKKSAQLLLFYTFTFLLMFSAIILTFSRSAWLALAVSVFVVGLIKYKWVIPIALVGIFLVYYAVPRVQTRISGVTDPSDSFYYRFISWSETYEVAKTNPIIGYGFNTYRYIRQDMGLIEYDEGLGDRSDSGSDSSILFIWVTTGFIGLFIFIIAHINLFFDSLRQSRTSKFALLFVGFLVALLINSQFINSMFFPALSVNFAIFTALYFKIKE